MAALEVAFKLEIVIPHGTDEVAQVPETVTVLEAVFVQPFPSAPVTVKALVETGFTVVAAVLLPLLQL